MAYLVEHNKEWSKMYRAQTKLIRKTLGKACFSTEHIGSTAIAGVPSRPIIDILVICKDTDACNRLTTIGYNSCDNGTYMLQGDAVSFCARCVNVDDHDTIDACMGILNQFRASKQATQAWADQKQAWAQQFEDDPQGYENAKKAYFEQISPAARDKNRQDQKLGSSLAIGMCLGMGVGTALGAALGNMAMGMCLGMGVGMCLGLALGSHQNKSNDKK